MRFFIINLLICQLYAITGYLYEYEVTDCQDACSQYAIHHEIQDIAPTNVIFDDSITNIDLYVNRFVEVDLGEEVTCVECNAFEVLEINLSQDCEFPVACFVDPCIVEECQINTPVDCISNYCGGCYADFYDLEGNLADCNSSVNDCIDLSGIPFPECGTVIGFGYVDGECQTMYCSPIDGYGVDWSNWIYNTIEECEEVCGTNNPITLGDINFDGEINVLDVVLLVSFILGDPTDELEYSAADMNGDSQLDVLDAVLLIEMILNPLSSIQINSGASYGSWWGYCVFELELDNSNVLFKASSCWNPYDQEYPDLTLEDNLNQESWQYLVNLIDFEYFQSLDDVYGCPDCNDGGAEFIQIIYEGVSKQVTFEAYSAIDGIEELTLLLRDLRIDYWNQVNQNQECYVTPEVGPCDGICPTYYYNQSTNQCEEFITGCCGVEAFNTLQECQNNCE